MSFSSDVKNELCSLIPKSVHCRKAELAGIIAVNGRMEEYKNEPAFIIRVENEINDYIIKKLLDIVFDIDSSEIPFSSERGHHNKLVIKDDELINDIFTRLKLRKIDRFLYPDDMLIQKSCCKKTYLRGAFLAGGYIGSPEKNNQLEITCVTDDEADKLMHIFESEHFSSKKLHRRNRSVVYIKDGDTISGILGIMGAPKSMMEFENIRILKDLRNSINREVNCDTANLAKTAKTSARQVEDIKYLMNSEIYDTLSAGLKQAAMLRLENPTLSTKELSELAVPPVSKSGINHRLRKLSSVAEELRGGKI